jgi:hypothetical protein
MTFAYILHEQLTCDRSIAVADNNIEEPYDYVENPVFHMLDVLVEPVIDPAGDKEKF